jgi:predicted amidohydrolase
VDKSCRLIEEAADKGAELIAFPGTKWGTLVPKQLDKFQKMR